MPSEHSSEFKNLVKKVGIRKAIEIMKEKGIVYSGDFTIDHRTDSYFSTPNIFENQKMNNSFECEYNIAYSPMRPSGNIYPQHTYPLSKPLEKIPHYNYIFDMMELVVIPPNHLVSQETTSGMFTPHIESHSDYQ